MKISKDKVVQLTYQLFDANDALLEACDEQDPQLYLHGHNNMMRSVELALEGKEAGAELSLPLAPVDAFGEREEGKLARVPIKHLIGAPKRLQVGMVVNVNTEQGAMPSTVIKVGKFNVDVDTNHPLAGESVRFELKVLDVRDATAEEIAHGHAHGPGGHHH
ncbi:MAG TPA: peptidylprolyl isomerase [Pseudomonadales bacterium]|nr:peptidylprolyl isomerase [Pseudomonadales bacterium]